MIGTRSTMRRSFGTAGSFIILGVLIAGCGGSSSSGGGSTTTTTGTSTGSNATAVAAINQLKTPQTQQAIDFQPFPFMIRATAATLPAVTQLIAAGPAGVEDILKEFRRTPTSNDDVLLSLLAYALEKIGDKRAISVLADWLDANLFVELPGWPTDFVTHTIKVLQPQSGINTTTFTYLINEKMDTLLQARQPGQTGGTTQGILPVQFVGQGVLDGNLTEEQKRICFKVIHVTGINAAGQEETLDLNYKTVRRDLNAVVADPTTSKTERDAGATRLEAWRSADEKIYGGSSYAPEPGSKITDATNCGGRVIEKIVNRLTTNLGIPITLGPGASTADAITQVAKKFGTEIGISEMDPLTVIAIEKDGNISHVEFPIAFLGGNSAVIQSKWDYGLDRTHTVVLSPPIPIPDVTQFAPSINQTNGNPFFVGGAGVRFFRIDPKRIKRIVVDSSLCPCLQDDPAGIPVQISQPTKDEVPDRVITVSGSVSLADAQLISVGKITVNGAQQDIAIAEGTFQAQVVLQSGDNDIRVSVEAVDGRRGCAIKKVKSTTPKTTLSATLTWNLGNSDVDLYVTQPDKQTSWYNSKTTSSGGRLDVDNTSGFGPENYFISLASDSPLRNGTYGIRVHYYRDHQQNQNTPTRPVTWKVVVLLNEGTPNAKYEIYSGTISVANPNNDTPGSGGPDWATAKDVSLSATP